nr:immunoglobulin heavy chain junction region [Macaca mulatta]MOV41948.1 immunoglobulin heavy chain junction region [Macaca mulatta]MOV42169.1 immunoglobulin heavy chain junction region [Macaca mulatta]MOV42574.1 immunoglobulin heavy chain junction region [Macaca mulatta]MOV42924.1 immunoglobulin heavy chain junction region [Macaca mulatta]
CVRDAYGTGLDVW